MSKHAPTRVSISTRSMVMALALLLGMAILWFIRDIVAVFFVALLLAALIDPFAHWFERRRIPRSVGVLIVYILLFSIAVGSVVLVVPPLVRQLSDLGQSLQGSLGSARGAIDDLRAFAEQYGLSENVAESLAGLQSNITGALQGVITTVADIFGGIATFILVLVLAFYMVVEEGAARRVLRSVTPKKYRAYVSGLMGRMQSKLGAWLRGQIVLMVVVGILVYIGLLIIGVEYPLVLALFAGIAELVPYAGPIISAVPAILIAFTISPLKAAIVALLYFGIQQLENSVLTPKIMQKSVGLNPVMSLFALMVGFKLAGLVGALLAIPVATMVTVFLDDVIGADDGSAEPL